MPHRRRRASLRGPASFSYTSLPTGWPSSSRNGTSRLRTSSTARADGRPSSALTEARVEEARIMNAKLTNRRVDWSHLRSKVRGNLHSLPRSQDVELVGIEDQPPILAGENWLPEILHYVAAHPADVDDVAVLDRPVADDGLAQTSKIDPQAPRPHAGRAGRRPAGRQGAACGSQRRRE